jgi:RNA polymerase sigma-70 factor (ECF subfamily)
MSTHDRFNRLANEVCPRLTRQAILLSRNKELANDLVQVTLTKAAQHFDKFDSERSTFLNWTLRILQRSFLDETRRRSRRPSEISFEGLLENSDTNLDTFDVVDEQVNILEDVIAQDEFAHLTEMLETLPAEYAEALRMSILEGYSYEQVAAHQNTTVGTVRSRIHRAKKILVRAAQERQLTSV